MSRTYTRESEWAAFGIVVIVIGIVLMTNFLLNLGADEKYVVEIRNLAEKLRLFLPEGEPLYTKAVEVATSAYVLKKGLESTYGDNVSILINLIKGNISIPVSHLFLGALAKYILALGFIKGLTVKMFKLLVVFPVVLGAILVLWGRVRTLRELKASMYARLYDPFGDRDIRTVLKILKLNPVPASIIHHNPHREGLLKHSLSVAACAADKAQDAGLDIRSAFLAGLLHDVGKLKSYVRDGNRWKSTGANLELMNRIAMKEIEKRFGVRAPQDENVWEIVREADREVTARELKEYKYEIEPVFERALRELNINGVGGSKYDGWAKDSLIVVLAHALNKKVTELLKELDPSLPFSEEPDVAGVHAIAYSNPYRKFILMEYDGKKADTLGLFDARVSKKIFNAVYLIKREAIPDEVRLRWGDLPYTIEILERQKT